MTLQYLQRDDELPCFGDFGGDAEVFDCFGDVVAFFSVQDGDVFDDLGEAGNSDCLSLGGFNATIFDCLGDAELFDCLGDDEASNTVCSICLSFFSGDFWLSVDALSPGTVVTAVFRKV